MSVTRSLLRPLSALALLAGGSLLAAGPALAWGHQAHAAIDRAAIEALPADGPVFLREQEDFIAASATIPDSWRHDSEPFAKIEEDPNHGWFRERTLFLKPLPRSRFAYILALYRHHLELQHSDPAAARWMSVRWTGTLPYAVMEQYGHLVSEMRQLRAARARGKTQEAGFLEINCANTVVRLGHYIGDGSQPLHDSIYSDGWKGPNPHHYTSDGRIHAQFESAYVKAIGLTAADVAAHVGAIDHQHGDLFETVVAWLDANNGRVESIYRLDQQGALTDPHNPQVRALIYEQTGSGAALLRDLLLRAWHEAAITPGAAHVDPLDPHTPDFDPATGSAPPPLSR